MSSSIVLLNAIWGLSLLLAGASAETKCRCEAECENFYNRRRLREASPRDLHNTPYDYSSAYVDEQGYTIVEGVRVLPANECPATGHPAEMKWGDNVARASGGGAMPSSTSDVLAGWLGIFGGGGRNLADEDRENNHNNKSENNSEDGSEVDADQYFDFYNDVKAVAQLRKLKGSSKGHYASTDDYYYSQGT